MPTSPIVNWLLKKRDINSINWSVIYVEKIAELRDQLEEIGDYL